jgi:hypothetical protein
MDELARNTKTRNPAYGGALRTLTNVRELIFGGYGWIRTTDPIIMSDVL